jgi:hypothetical protein
MRRVLLTATAVLIGIGLAGTAHAQGNIVRFTANLSGANEAPTPVLTGAFATATVTLDLGTQTVSWNIDVFNMPSGTNNAHFHVGGPGLGGPTVVNVAFPAGISNDYNLSGSATAANLLVRADQGIRSWDDFLQALLGGQTYLNIHSVVNGGGEIRGQVIRVP